jgi:ArsR family transcriptional regulator
VTRRANPEVLAVTLKALASPARLEILTLLAGHRGGQTPKWVEGSLTHRLTQPTVSHHLRTLFNAGLLTRKELEGPRDRGGEYVFYAVSASGMDRVLNGLAGLR